METITPAAAAARTAFRVTPIPAEVLARIRAAGHDDFGNPLVPAVSEEGGDPMRCCLRRAAPGDRLCLIAYRPFARPGPCAESGPVFIHAEACAGYDSTGAYPPGYRDWPAMVFRPYRYDGSIAYDAIAMGDGPGAEALIASMLADPSVEFIHTRNVYAGCFMFRIGRPGA
ncbi:MAG TPA: DUF1203 domain-containing protein [Streptosporangiaceae bacterium]